MVTSSNDTQTDATFLDMQAHIGITKHTGGLEATKELLSLCHVEDAREVLNVGCGIGVASTYIASNYGCRVMGVDLSEKMIEWSRRRAREERVEDKVEFQTADVQELPFEADRFGVVFAESVLVFVEDKARAIEECVRVTRPGGYVGLNEAVWTREPSPEMVAQVRAAIGPYVPTAESWEALWEASGLQERVVEIHQVDPSTEVKSRIGWIGWSWLLRAWGRGLRLYLTKPSIRRSMKAVFDVPPEVFEYAGYGLFVGRK